MNKQTLNKTYQSLDTVEEMILECRIEPATEMNYPLSFLNMQDFLSLKKHDLRPLKENREHKNL